MKKYLRYVLVTTFLFWGVVILWTVSVRVSTADERMESRSSTGTASIFYLETDEETEETGKDSDEVYYAKQVCNLVDESLQDIGMYTYVQGRPTVSGFNMCLKIRDMIFIQCHGSANALHLVNGDFTSASISSTADYGDCKLAYLSCCNLGADDEQGDNLSEALIDAGVKSVVACADRLTWPYCEYFAEYFFDYIVINRYSVGNAYSNTIATLYSQYPYQTARMEFFGNTSTTLP